MARYRFSPKREPGLGGKNGLVGEGDRSVGAKGRHVSGRTALMSSAITLLRAEAGPMIGATLGNKMTTVKTPRSWSNCWMELCTKGTRWGMGGRAVGALGKVRHLAHRGPSLPWPTKRPWLGVPSGPGLLLLLMRGRKDALTTFRNNSGCEKEIIAAQLMPT